MVNGITVIIPVYNEAAILVDNCLYLMELIGKHNTPFEIIIGSNGSTDNTDALGNELSHKYQQIKFFSLPKRRVVGTIFKEAVKMARYEKLISLDMDLTIDLSFIDSALELLKENDLVIGSKKAGKESRSWIRRHASKTYVWLVRSILGMGFSDYSIGAKAFLRSSISPHIDKLDKSTGYILTLTYLLYKDERRIAQIPVNCVDRRGSKFSMIEESFYRFFQLLSLRFRSLN